MNRLYSAYYDKMARIFTKDDSHYDLLVGVRKSAYSTDVSTVTFKDFTDFVMHAKEPTQFIQDVDCQRYFLQNVSLSESSKLLS